MSYMHMSICICIAVDLNFRGFFHKVGSDIIPIRVNKETLSLFLYLDLTIEYLVNFSVVHAERSRFT